MTRNAFRTPTGRHVTAVTADEMREIDSVAVEEVKIQLLQMMENAGRILSWHIREVRDEDASVIVVAGNGGNGGGGMACARHLVNRGIHVRVLQDRSSENLSGVAAAQHRILEEMGVETSTDVDRIFQSVGQCVIVDALIGYGLDDTVRRPAKKIINTLNRQGNTIVSLDVPSGIDATTGNILGNAVTPDRTVTLALPKTGLEAIHGTLYLADISIPETVYERLGIEYECPFGVDDWIKLSH